MAEWCPSGRWVIVTGQGTHELSEAQYWTSLELGSALANAGHGIVTGRWPGVDYVVAESYANRLKTYGVEPSRFLIQVVRVPWSGGYPGGLLVETAGRQEEREERLKYPGPVVLIGGANAAYDNYRIADAQKKVVLPLAGTGGQAARAHGEIVKYWTYCRPRGVALEDFQELGRPIESREGAAALVQRLMAVIGQTFAAERPDTVFVSYAREDAAWATALREFLMPAERTGLLALWDDSRIQPGVGWESEIRRAISESKVAVLLVSHHFLASQFIMKVELPLIRSRAQERQLAIDWVYVSSCLYRYELGDLQAAHEIIEPVDRLSPAEQNALWVRVADLIETQVKGEPRPGHRG